MAGTEDTSTGGDDLSTRLDALDAEIERARSSLAKLRHQGERHFIDDVEVDPQVTDLLHSVVEHGDRMRRAAGPPATRRPFIPPGTDDEHARLLELEGQISNLRRLANWNLAEHQQHFIDG